MELNAKISSLEDEVKLLKGEVKLILSEIRAAVLSQNGPFGQGPGLATGPDQTGSRPPIRVVKVPEEGEDEEEPAVLAAPSWDEEEAPRQSFAEPTPPVRDTQEPPPRPSAAEWQPPAQTAAARAEAPSPPPREAPMAANAPAAPPRPAGPTSPSWSLIKVAGLAVWAEEALKQVGPERLETLLDLCEFAGYLPASAKEALMRVTNLGIAIDERTETPSVNECLVILYQLHALMQGEEPEALRGRLATGK